MRSSAQPYLLAIFAGAIAILANYVIATFNNEQAISQKQLERRIAAYSGFIEKTVTSTESSLSRLFGLGDFLEHVVTDDEIQRFEDRAADLLQNHDIYELRWQFISASAPLQLLGSKHALKICNDIQNALLNRDFEIEWSEYSPEAALIIKNLKEAQATGESYGTEDRISDDERLMIASVSKLAEALIKQLRLEVMSNNPMP